MTNLDPNVMVLVDGYDRRKNPAKRLYRRMLISEAKELQYGDSVRFIANDGTARCVKVNGKPKTWKRDPNRVHVPIKYGLYEYATFQEMDDTHMNRLLVEVAAVVQLGV